MILRLKLVLAVIWFITGLLWVGVARTTDEFQYSLAYLVIPSIFLAVTWIIRGKI